MQKGIPLGDFPEPRQMQQKLSPMDFSSFKPVDPVKMQALDTLLSVDLPKLVQMIPEEASEPPVAFGPLKAVEEKGFKGRPPVIEDFREAFERIGPKDGKIDAQQARQKMVEAGALVLFYMVLYIMNMSNEANFSSEMSFESLRPLFSSPFDAQSHLPSNVLQRIWLLADVDQDGYLTLSEYAVAMHLVALKMQGEDLPETLPRELWPLE